MKCMCYKHFVIMLFSLSLCSCSVVANDLKKPLLEAAKEWEEGVSEARKKTLTKSQQRLMDKIRNGEGIAMVLVSVGSPDFADQHGDTPLIVAASHGRSRIVRQLLLVDQAGINRQNDEGDTALIVAARNGHAGVVRVLLRYKGILDVDVANNDGKTAIDVARDNDHENVAQLIQAFVQQRR